MELDRINSIVETLAEMPFNTFRNFLLEDSQPSAPELGGNCIHFMHQVLKQIPEARPLVGSGTRRHQASILRTEGETYLLDPSLGARQAIALGDLSEGEVRHISTLPCVSSDNPTLQIRKLGGLYHITYDLHSCQQEPVSWTFDPDKVHAPSPESQVSAQNLGQNFFLLERNPNGPLSVRVVFDIGNRSFLKVSKVVGSEKKQNSLKPNDRSMDWKGFFGVELDVIMDHMEKAGDIQRKLLLKRYLETGIE